MKISDLGPEMTVDAEGYAVERTNPATEPLFGRVAPDQSATVDGQILLVTMFDYISGAFSTSIFPVRRKS